jgi:hypothetical protein
MKEGIIDLDAEAEGRYSKGYSGYKKSPEIRLPRKPETSPMPTEESTLSARYKQRREEKELGKWRKPESQIEESDVKENLNQDRGNMSTPPANRLGQRITGRAGTSVAEEESPSDKDYMGVSGKSKRLENENQILLKNNSELRRENMELKSRLEGRGEYQELLKRIAQLEEMNHDLEGQLQSITISPIHSKALHQEADSLLYRRPGGKSYLSQTAKSFFPDSMKGVSQTDRGGLGGYRGDSAGDNTKSKFAESILDMVKQLVPSRVGPEDYKGAWKVLKNVVGEYFELKKEKVESKRFQGDHELSAGKEGSRRFFRQHSEERGEQQPSSKWKAARKDHGY